MRPSSLLLSTAALTIGPLMPGAPLGAPPQSAPVAVHDATQMAITGPSIVAVGETVRFRGLGLDERWRRLPPWKNRRSLLGPVEISATDGTAQFPSHVQIHAEDDGHFSFPVTFHSPGIHYVRGADPMRPDVRGESNPVWVMGGTPRLRLYWGDLHGHTCFSDGQGSPESFLAHARDVSHLDFVAITDHADEHAMRGSLVPWEWAEILDQVTEASQENQFLAFAGFEWTSNEWGHRHVVYRDPWGNYLSNATDDYDEPAELYAALADREGEVLILPHHSNHGHRLEAHHRALEPLVEVYSRHGASETCPHPIWPGPCSDWSEESASYVDMLMAGRRIGAIGSGDSHDGFPGRILGRLPDSDGCDGQNGRVPSLPRTGGLAGVASPRLTAPDLFDALTSRATVATSGPRFVLLLEINGAPMGREIESDGPPHIRFTAAGRRNLTAEIVRDGEVIHRVDPSGRIVRANFIDESFSPPPGAASHYYLRVIQEEDREWGWTSPVWVKRPTDN